MNVSFGRFYNEFRGTRISDKVSIMVFDFPLFVIRKYTWLHSSDHYRTWHFAILGLTFGISRRG